MFSACEDQNNKMDGTSDIWSGYEEWTFLSENVGII